MKISRGSGFSGSGAGSATKTLSPFSAWILNYFKFRSFMGWENEVFFQHGRQFPAVDCLISMFLMEPTGSVGVGDLEVGDLLERGVLGG